MIALGIVAGKPLLVQLAVLSGIAVAMTAGVYGLVGAIVKMDDAGLYLARKYPAGALHQLGRGLLAAAPLCAVAPSAFLLAFRRIDAVKPVPERVTYHAH
mgnify:CR=1 FL=1